MKPSKPLTKVQRIFLIIFGVAALGCATVVLVLDGGKMYRATSRTSGVISDIRYKGGISQGISSYGVTFVNQGQTYSFRQEPALVIPLRHFKDKVEIMFNPNDPTDAFISPWLLFLPVPLLLLACGAILLISAFRKEPKET